MFEYVEAVITPPYYLSIIKMCNPLHIKIIDSSCGPITVRSGLLRKDSLDVGSCSDKLDPDYLRMERCKVFSKQVLKKHFATREKKEVLGRDVPNRNGILQMQV